VRRDDALLTLANVSVSAFLVLAGPSVAVATADPGGSHGNGGNGKSGSSQGGSSRSSAGNGNSGNGGSAARGNPAGNSSVSGRTNTGSSSNGKGGGNGNGNGNGANAQSNSGSDGPDTAPPTPPNPMVPVVVAEQHTGTTAGRSWWGAPAAAPVAVEVHAPAALHMEGDADLLAADHTGIPVWAAAEPVGLRGDLFGLAGLVLMPLIGLAVGYRQAKAARDIGQTLPS
jgi:hypothetical protein